MTGPPGPFLKQFMALQIPDDLRDGFGYPQITYEDKRKILGLNMARLFDVDVEEKITELGLKPQAAGVAAEAGGAA
jgi:hypothetical protein